MGVFYLHVNFKRLLLNKNANESPKSYFKYIIFINVVNGTVNSFTIDIVFFVSEVYICVAIALV